MADHSKNTSDAPAAPIFRANGISYLHIPSTNPALSARFYATVFGWSVQERGHGAAFEDGTGHVIGAFVTKRAPSGDTGVLPYVYVDNVDAVMERVNRAGGQTRKPAQPEGNLRVATFTDPSGTVMGVWQRT
jgi:predicted enzyme related to lactoylglutathione lyase